MDLSIEFVLGEKKILDFEVLSTDNAIFTITSAEYRLKDKNEILLTGESDIREDIISVLLEPLDKGSFVLEVEYAIPPEIRIGRAIVNVS